MVEAKSKIIRYDLALLSHQYDIRVNAASEDPQTVKTIKKPNDWTLERRKRRKTFKAKSPNYSAWKIDLTDVDVKVP
jgi:hypothetical protein